MDTGGADPGYLRLEIAWRSWSFTQFCFINIMYLCLKGCDLQRFVGKRVDCLISSPRRSSVLSNMSFARTYLDSTLLLKDVRKYSSCGLTRPSLLLYDVADGRLCSHGGFVDQSALKKVCLS